MSRQPKDDMKPQACSNCQGDRHLVCFGHEDAPCGCGCFLSARSLHKHDMRRNQTYNRPLFLQSSRVVAQLLADGTYPA